MSYTRIIKPEAELDIIKATKWYEEKKKGLGIKFLDEIEEKLDIVTSNPLHYQVRYKNTRLAFLRNFPYSIHFILEEKKIYILAILGTREDPEKWQ